ncbi:MAG: hypothetical protein GWP14_10950 [Actinobacteria bacterium]|nr:hypothetical protein [Actinomycetota bacterium]
MLRNPLPESELRLIMVSGMQIYPANSQESPEKTHLRTIAHLTLGLLILGFIWRLTRFVMGFPIWGDEAFIVTSFYTRDFAGLIDPLEYRQIAPLGFMWLELATSRLLGMSEWALRTPAFVCGLFSLLLFWRFSRRSLDHYSALLAVGIFAVSYYVVRHSVEVKPYAGDLAVSLVLIYLGWSVYCRSDSFTRWLALIVAAPVAVWLSYPAVFVAGSVAMLLTVLLWQQRSRKVFIGCLIYLLLFAASFAAMYFIYARPHAQAAAGMFEGHTWRRSFPPMAEPWRLPWWFLKVHTGNLLAYPFGGKRGGSTLTFILVIIGSVTLWRQRRRPFLLLLLGPLVLMLIAAGLRKYPYGTSARVAQHMAPAFCLLAGVGLLTTLRFFLKDRFLRGCYIATAVIAVIAVGGTVHDILLPQKKFSDRANRDVLRTLADRTAPHDQWIIFNATGSVPYAPDLSLWGGSAARFRYYVHRLGPENVYWSPPPRQITRPDVGRTWLLVYRDNKSPFPQDLLDRYLKTARRRLGKPQRHWFELTSPKDPPRRQVEAIEVYEFPART